MIYCELTNNSGEIVYSTIPKIPEYSNFEIDKKRSFTDGKFKQVYKIHPNGSVRLIGKKDCAELATSKIANRTTDVYAELFLVIKNIKEHNEMQYSIFSHNLITAHSLLQDEIESIISEEKLARAKTYTEQVSEIKKSLTNNIDSVSESIFEIAKRIIDLQAQITGFKILSREIKPQIKPQNIKKVLFNMLYPYYNGFKEKDVSVRVSIDENVAINNLVAFDYKIINIALHHFFNNTVKYTLPNSYVDISFNPTKKELIFEMVSVRIEHDEIQKIFKLKTKGKNTQDLPGDGIGMFMIEQSLKLLNAEIKIHPDYSYSKEFEGKKYTKNKFIMHFYS